jgi:outer membrane protein OmpA-like peptidoglycan-associated protein
MTRTFQILATTALALTATLSLTGCRQQKRADLATNEAVELRAQNEAYAQSIRDKDARIAELEAQAVNNQAAMGGSQVGWAQPQPSYPQSPVPAPQGNWNNDQPNFQPNSQGEMVATIAGNVLFDSGSATIKADAKRKLDSIVGELKKQYGGAQIRVEGHTDSDPIKVSKWKTNDALSQARAEAVRSYIVSKGISAGRIEAMGFGASKPKATKAASRRVEIVVSQ